MLVRSLSKVGITTLIDEATGYQEQRERDELHKLLSIYLTDEKLRWAKRFPDEFYRNLYRLIGWNYSSDGKRHRYTGVLTNQLVYDRLPSNVREELKKRNPRNPETGRRKHCHHQYLSEDIGQQDLRDHFLQLLPIMRLSDNWAEFYKLFKVLLTGKTTLTQLSG